MQEDNRQGERRHDHWPSRDNERHWHTYMLAALMLMMTLVGWFLVDTLQIVRDDVTEVKHTVNDIEDRLIEVEKKLEAVATDNGLLRKTYESHLSRLHE